MANVTAAKIEVVKMTLRHLQTHALRAVSKAFGVPTTFFVPGSGTRYLKNSTIAQRIVERVRTDEDFQRLVAILNSGGGNPAPDGAEKAPDGAEKAPDGAEKAPDGAEKAPDQKEGAPDQPEGGEGEGEEGKGGEKGGGKPPSIEDIIRALAREEAGKLDDGVIKLAAEAINDALKGAKSSSGTVTLKFSPPDGAEKREIEGLTHEAVKDLLTVVAANVPVLLVGPAGCGKSHLAEQAAKAMGMRYGFVSCSTGMSESHLLGRFVLRKGGEFEYVTAQFVDFYEHGGLFLLDEVDASDPNVMVVINAAIANGHMAVPNRPDKPVAVRHENFRLVAAANTYGHGADRQYVGRNQLDAATLDRFAVIEMGYSAALEEALIPEPILTWGRAVRKSIEDQKIRRILSTRAMINAAKMQAAGMESKRARQVYFSGWKKDELDRIPEELR